MSETLHGAALALGASVTFGVFSLFARRGRQHANEVTGVLIGLFVSVPLFWLGVLLNWQPHWWNLEAIVYFALAGFFGSAVGRTLLFRSLHEVGVARTVPIISATPLLSTTLAYLFLGERPGAHLWAGTFLIVAGCAALAIREEGEPKLNPRTLWMPFACVAGHALSLIFRKSGMMTVPSPLFASATASLAGLIFLAISLRFLPASLLPDFRQRWAWHYFTVCGLLNLAGFFLLNYALHLAGVSIAVPLNATSPLVALLLSYFFLRDVEQVTRWIVSGTVSILLGVALISWQSQ